MKIKDLRLALSATPKKSEVRFYLNGVNITKHNVVGSDGSRLCFIHTFLNKIPDDHANIIIPTDTIKALLKKIGSKNDNSDVCIFLNNNRYELSCLNQVEIFTPIDHKYPDFKKILEPVKNNNHDKNLNSILHQFNWELVASSSKAICTYFNDSVPKRLYSCELCGYMMPSEEVFYIIMPMRL